MELELNFAAHLTTHLCPSYSKVVSLLNQTVSQWPKGSAMLTGNKGIFTIKLWDREKAEKLKGQKVEYFYEGEKSKKSVKVAITEKSRYHKYNNPKYITIMGFDRSPGELLTNEKMDNIMLQFGDIIDPTQDVYAEHFLTGKKKIRLDLNKEIHIPRDFHVQVESESGRSLTVTLRVYYKDQPYHCKSCVEKHIGDCPKRIAEKEEKQRIKKVKEENTHTVLIGDSNFRCANENGLMANVTAVTGAKLGHVCNQLEFENLENVDTIILSAGQNCINDIHLLGPKLWETRTIGEISKTEKVMNSLLEKGKNVFLLSVPPAPCTQITQSTKDSRLFINKHLSAIVERANTIDAKTGIAGFIAEADSSYDQETDFTDDKHLSQHAMERRIGKLDDVLSDNRKLRNPVLKARPTCDPYRGCYGAYPAGCMYCTKVGHSEQDCPCPTISASKKRREVSGSDMNEAKVQKNR